MELRTGVAGFADVRRTAEDDLWRAGRYTLDDIYATLREKTGWSTSILEMLKVLELHLEWDNIFPIVEVMDTVQFGDLVVSDMYLPLPFLRKVLEYKCNLRENELHLTNHGKHHGTVWGPLLEDYDIQLHTGDNLNSDVIIPQRYGIATQHTSAAEWSTSEFILRDIGLRGPAEVIREARLSFRDSSDDPLHARARSLQWEVNTPFLAMATVSLGNHADSVGADTILMCARDCGFWYRIAKKVLGGRFKLKYITASRILFTSGNPAYAAYVRSRCGERTVVADLSGTGRTPAHFIGTYDAQSDMSVYLALRSNLVHPDMETLAPFRPDVHVEHMVECEENRFLFEKFNATTEGRAVGMEFHGFDFFALREDSLLTEENRKLVETMASTLDAIDFTHCFPPSALFIPDDIIRTAASVIIGEAPRYADVVSDFPD